MSEIKDGGPAFPTDHSTCDSVTIIRGGMSLRDYFAAKAMQGMTGCGGIWMNPIDAPEIAKRVYAMADAMLKEREK